MTDAVIKRLEAVAAKLEAFAGSAQTGAGAGSSGSSSGGAKVAAYDAWFSANAQPFLDAANSVEGSKGVVRNSTPHSEQGCTGSPVSSESLTHVADSPPSLRFLAASLCSLQAKNAEEGLKFVRTVLQAADASKKPSQSDFTAFLKPLGAIIERGSNPDSRDKAFNQQKAWAEGQAGAIAWVQVEPATAGMTPKQVTAPAAQFDLPFFRTYFSPVACSQARTRCCAFVSYHASLLTRFVLCLPVSL